MRYCNGLSLCQVWRFYFQPFWFYHVDRQTHIQNHRRGVSKNGTIYFLNYCACGNVQAECRRAIDIAFLLHCSDADDNNDAWNSTLQFVDEIVSHIRPRSGGTHVALALSNHHTTTIIRKLDHHPLIAVQNLSRTCLGQERDISRSLKIIKRSVFNNGKGDRPEVPDVLVLVVRGVGVGGVEVAASLKADGIKIITVAMAANQQTLKQLRRLASSDEDARKLVVARVEQYRVLMPTIINVLCRRHWSVVNGNLLSSVLMMVMIIITLIVIITYSRIRLCIRNQFLMHRSDHTSYTVVYFISLPPLCQQAKHILSLINNVKLGRLHDNDNKHMRIICPIITTVTVHYS